MRRWGFRYKKADNFHFYIEKPDVMEDCRKFLSDFDRLVNQQYTPVYGDESWVPANHTVPSTWQWKEFDKHGRFVGFKGTMKIKSGAGERLIINHFVHEGGFVPNALDLFVGKTGSGDYHTEMNGLHYEDYIKKMAPNLPDKTMLVTDKASYHSVMTEDSRYPVSNWKKEDILTWFQSRGITSTDDRDLAEWTKAQLLEFAKKHKPPTKYVIDEILKEIPNSNNTGMKNIVVLRLPTKHCFFNPIEMVWANIKGYVAKNNHACTIKDTLRLTHEGVNAVSNDYIRKCFRHVRGLMESFKESGRYISCEVEPLIIENPFSDDSDDSESDTFLLSEDNDDNWSASLDDEQLDLDTDEELDEELREQPDNDQEVNTILAINEETARDNKTRWKTPLKCTCKSGCHNNMCGCNKGGQHCNPACQCSDSCVNRRQIGPGFEMRTTVSVAVPTSRQPPPDSSNASLPAPDPPSQPKRKPKSRKLGFCKCSSRGSCSAGYCVCYADRVVCNPQCTCQPYCQNKDAKKLSRLPPKNAFRLSDPGPARAAVASTNTDRRSLPSTSLSVFDFDD